MSAIAEDPIRSLVRLGGRHERGKREHLIPGFLVGPHGKVRADRLLADTMSETVESVLMEPR